MATLTETLTVSPESGEPFECPVHSALNAPAYCCLFGYQIICLLARSFYLFRET